MPQTSIIHRMALPKTYRVAAKIEFLLAFPGGRKVTSKVYRLISPTPGLVEVYVLENIDYPLGKEISEQAFKTIVITSFGGIHSVISEVLEY